MLNNVSLAKSISANVADYMMSDAGITVWRGLRSENRNVEEHIATVEELGDSLYPVVSKVLDVIDIPRDVYDLMCLEVAFKGLITSVWEAVWYKWSFAFDSYKRYKDGYTLLNTKGVHAIHIMLTDCVDFLDDKMEIPQVLGGVAEDFRNKLEKSHVNETDWLVGGTFHNLKGSEGYQQMADMLEIPDILHKQRAGETTVGTESTEGVAAWEEVNTVEHVSRHIYVMYLGDEVPEYKVIRNPEGEGWVLAKFDDFIGEYTAFNDDFVFESEVAAMSYVDGLV
ncbi:hypothetical protein [Bacillus sp. NEAU-Y102]